MPLAPLELVTFGAPSARIAGRETPPELRWRKHLALLVYLALSPSRSRSRDHLLGLLWAEQPESGARKAFNTAVFRLRQELGEDRLRNEGDALALSDEALEVDALRFAAQAESAPDEALPLLRGDFLEGFYVEGAPEFEDWMARERERYRTLATSTWVAAGERRLSAGRLSDAADIAHRALAQAPRSEPAVRLAMRAAALTGDSASAMATYHAFAKRLDAEIHEAPSRALAALAERIRTGSWHPVGTKTARAAPLVGREQVHRLAFDTIAQAVATGGGPRTLVIASPPGMGRTRLLSECAARLSLEGARVLQARPVETDHDTPWSTLRLLLRDGIADSPGLLAARRNALSVLAMLIPELAERFPPRQVADVADMASALSDVIGAISEEQPVAFALDDAHWADGASLAALDATFSAIKNRRAALIVTVAQGIGEPPRELLHLQSAVGRDIPGLTVRLGALDQDELVTLVQTLAPWCKDTEERARLTRRITIETAGSPFLAVTLLGSLAGTSTLRSDLTAWPPPRGTKDAPLPFSIPSLVRTAIVMRAGELQRDELAALRAASVCGEVFDLELVAGLCGQSVDAIERALQGSERRHLIQFDGRRYRFEAAVIAEVIRTECLTRGERRALERQVSDALASRTDLESQVLRVTLLAHCAPDRSAYDLALETAEQALAGGAHRIAARAVAAADRISREAALDRSKLEQLRSRL